MKKKQDGGPTFPISTEVKAYGLTGMTLRDWFAGQALVGLNASLVEQDNFPDLVQARLLADKAYEQADAMLAERSK